jgi:hypothetical protein
MHPEVRKGLDISALWIDIYNGDIYVFSKKEKEFLILNDSTYKTLLGSVNLLE